LTEGFRKAAKIVRLAKGDNGLEAWRKLVRKFDPQNAEVHAAQLEHIVTFGTRNVVKQLGDVPTVLDQFRRVLDDYEEATGDCGINDSTKKTIMMQLLPASLRVAIRATRMVARQTFVGVSAEYLETIIVQRCEFDEAAMGSAIPMDAGGVDTGNDEAASLGQRGVGPGLGKGGGAGLGKGGAYRAPTAPTSRQLPPGGTLGWEKYKWTNDGFPPNTCGGCGAEDHYRNDCPKNPNKGKFPPKGKGKGKNGKGKGKGKWGKAGAVEDEDETWTEEAADGQAGAVDDEGNGLWDWDEGDTDCGWAVDDHDEDESDDEVQMITTGAQYSVPSPKSDVSDSEDEEEEVEEKDEFDVVTGNESIAF